MNNSDMNMESENNKAFCGFPEGDPVLPYFIDHLLAEISSLAELKVTLFIIRNTDLENKNVACITLTEFMKGMRDEDGNLLNHGVGIARQHIIKGIALAEERGTILTYTDASQRRKRRWFFINTAENRKLVHALETGDLSIKFILNSQKHFKTWLL